MKNNFGAAFRVWNLVKAISTDEVAARYAAAATLAVAGSDQAAEVVLEQLAHSRPGTPGGDISPRAVRIPDILNAPAGVPVIDADRSAADPEHLAARIVEIVAANPELRIALARRFPAFRPAVVERSIAELSLLNAKLAGLSALPGIVPLGDWLLPFAAAGDLMALTRNQVELFLIIAACYGLEPDLRKRVREFAVVVGGAYVWRAAARQAIGWVPAGIGVVVKAAVAYAGTYAIGRASDAYFGSGGHSANKADLRRYFREGLRAIGRDRAS